MTAIAREVELAAELLEPLIQKAKEEELRFDRQVEELRAKFLAAAGEPEMNLPGRDAGVDSM